MVLLLSGSGYTIWQGKNPWTWEFVASRVNSLTCAHQLMVKQAYHWVLCTVAPVLLEQFLVISATVTFLSSVTNVTAWP